MTDRTFHVTEEDLRKADSISNRIHRGREDGGTSALKVSRAMKNHECSNVLIVLVLCHREH